MTDLSHLHAIEHRLSVERGYLTNARTPREREMRKVWVAQIEKELASEKAFLGFSEARFVDELTDEELLAGLSA